MDFDDLSDVSVGHAHSQMHPVFFAPVKCIHAVPVCLRICLCTMLPCCCHAADATDAATDANADVAVDAAVAMLQTVLL